MSEKWKELFFSNLESSVEDWKNKAIDNFMAALPCGSEIEDIMLAELAFCPFGFFDCPHEIYSVCGPGCIPDKDINAILLRRDVVIAPQHIIGRYRADFAVFIKDFEGSIIKLVVECDGHAFHEKTKDQAARDKKRDRYLQSVGFRVFRFTGSEIFNNVSSCCDELDIFVANLIEKRDVAA